MSSRSRQVVRSLLIVGCLASVLFAVLSWFLCMPRAVVRPLQLTPSAHRELSRQAALEGRLEVRYPLAARRRGIEGVVLLELRVSETGTVSEVTLLGDAHPLLAKSARQAAESAKFIPAVRQGRAVETVVKLPVRFELE